MRHGFKKTKFGNGRDADRMLFRKLTINFFLNGRIETTLSKIKALKPKIEKLVTKIKRGAESDKNYLIQSLDYRPDLESRWADIKTALSAVKGGYTKIVKLGFRDSDGAPVARLEWAYPVVMNEVKKQPEKKRRETNKKNRS